MLTDNEELYVLLDFIIAKLHCMFYQFAFAPDCCCLAFTTTDLDRLHWIVGITRFWREFSVKLKLGYARSGKWNMRLPILKPWTSILEYRITRVYSLFTFGLFCFMKLCCEQVTQKNYYMRSDQKLNQEQTNTCSWSDNRYVDTAQYLTHGLNWIWYQIRRQMLEQAW